MATPLSTIGVKGGTSETGLATIEVPLYIDTLAEALPIPASSITNR